MSLKVLCDVHIAYKIVKFFESKNCEAIHVNHILDGPSSKDSDIAAFADKHEYIVVTKDSDFKISHFVQGKPQRVLKINLGNIPTLRLIEILEENFEIISDQFTNPRRFVEIGEGYLETL